MTYDRRAAAPNQYADDLDTGFIAQQVVLYGKSRNWETPTRPELLKVAQEIEHALSKYNIGVIDEATGTWGHKPGGSHFYRGVTL